MKIEVLILNLILYPVNPVEELSEKKTRTCEPEFSKLNKNSQPQGIFTSSHKKKREKSVNKKVLPKIQIGNK